jgi:hypothetical protein
MARVKKDESPKREPPVQLRTGPDLGRLLYEFSSRHNLQLNDACKRLVALALTELDCRFYDLVNQLAHAMGGSNAFVHACTHLQAALAGAGRLRGQPIRFDPERAVFVLQTIREFLSDRGLQVDESGLWFVAEQKEGPSPPELHQRTAQSTSGRRKRKVRPLKEASPQDQGQSASETQQADEEETPWSSIEEQPKQARVHQRE